MEPINVTTRDFYIYSLLLNIGLGVLVGLVPLVVGFMKRRPKYGFWGLILSVVGSAILGLILAIPVAAVMTWLIISRWSKTGSDSPPAA